LRHGVATMDTLVSIGITVASLWSVYTIFGPSTPTAEPSGVWEAVMQSDAIYFEVATGVTTFVLFGRFLEARATRRAGDTLEALAALAAKDVTVITRSGAEMRIPADRLGVGDVFVTRPGETIAADAVVEGGASLVDTSMMTGESRPVPVDEGDDVVGGTVAVSGRLRSRSTAVGEQTRLAEMSRMVAEAQSGKADAQRLADRVSSVFVPIVLLLSLATFVAWWVLGEGSVTQAANAALAEVIVARPCARGPATPSALTVGSGRGAQRATLIQRPHALEAPGRAGRCSARRRGWRTPPSRPSPARSCGTRPITTSTYPPSTTSRTPPASASAAVWTVARSGSGACGRWRPRRSRCRRTCGPRSPHSKRAATPPAWRRWRGSPWRRSASPM